MTDNIIKFPKKFNGKKMPVIHNIGENGIDIKNERFIGDISFLNEVVRGILYRDIGFKHPIQPFMEALVQPKMDKDANTVTTRVDLNLLEDLLSKKEDDTS